MRESKFPRGDSRPSGRPGAGFSKLRPLNIPQPVLVDAGEEGAPRMMSDCAAPSESKVPKQVTCIRDQWRIDDEWWRTPLSRRYFQVILEDGRCVTLYHDLMTGAWYRQRY
ncbi:MAG TPA: hypothetical protein VFJ58_20105 [Armatimonadota bacterium]|nr:hypothetical protein [Armatimonadota bacterium]